MELELFKQLLGYGVLGVVAVLAILFARSKDRDNKALHVSYQAKIDTFHAEHREEMRKLLERYISKAESWVEQYSTHARELRVLISAIRGQNSP